MNFVRIEAVITKTINVEKNQASRYLLILVALGVARWIERSFSVRKVAIKSKQLFDYFPTYCIIISQHIRAITASNLNGNRGKEVLWALLVICPGRV